MRIIWAPAARDDIKAIGDYVSHHNRAAAAKLVRRLTGVAPLIAAHPGIGRPGRVAGTREFVVTGTPYIMVYRVRDEVEIVRLLHSARLWPDSF